MKYRSAYLASALTAAAVMISPASAQQTDWSKRVTQSSIGGHVMGNPLAKNRLVEYVSYTCSHCADFEVASSAPLKSGLSPRARSAQKCATMSATPSSRI